MDVFGPHCFWSSLDIFSFPLFPSSPFFSPLLFKKHNFFKLKWVIWDHNSLFKWWRKSSGVSLSQTMSNKNEHLVCSKTTDVFCHVRYSIYCQYNLTTCWTWVFSIFSCFLLQSKNMSSGCHQTEASLRKQIHDLNGMKIIDFILTQTILFCTFNVNSYN